jgi:hypothetical protein
MEFIINKNFTKKLKNIKEIGNETKDGFIMAINKDDSIHSLSQEIFELVVVNLMDKKKVLVECFDRKYKITLEEVV